MILLPLAQCRFGQPVMPLPKRLAAIECSWRNFRLQVTVRQLLPVTLSIAQQNSWYVPGRGTSGLPKSAGLKTGFGDLPPVQSHLV
jgi:hypothetical protein